MNYLRQSAILNEISQFEKPKGSQSQRRTCTYVHRSKSPYPISTDRCCRAKSQDNRSNNNIRGNGKE